MEGITLEHKSAKQIKFSGAPLLHLLVQSWAGFIASAAAEASMFMLHFCYSAVR